MKQVYSDEFYYNTCPMCCVYNNNLMYIIIYKYIYIYINIFGESIIYIQNITLTLPKYLSLSLVHPYSVPNLLFAGSPCPPR